MRISLAGVKKRFFTKVMLSYKITDVEELKCDENDMMSTNIRQRRECHNYERGVLQMNMDSREFCCQLNEWKEMTGKKDIDFCREMGIHKNTLLNWKNGDSAPRAKHLEKLCKLFGIKEIDLAPLSFYTAKDNENKLYYRTQQLQRYAKAKGLDEDFYKRVTSTPYFLKEFPFSCTQDRFMVLKCPEWLSEDEEYRTALRAIPLSKYEFQDDYNLIIMLTEDDIDFLVYLQQKSENVIRDEMYLELRRKEEQRNRDLVIKIASWHLEDGHPIDADALYNNLMKNDFAERVITGASIWDRFQEYAETHNITSKPFKDEMLEDIERRHAPMSKEEEHAWREHYAAAGMTEEEIEEEIQRREKLRKSWIEFEQGFYKPEQKEEE